MGRRFCVLCSSTASAQHYFHCSYQPFLHVFKGHRKVLQVRGKPMGCLCSKFCTTNESLCFIKVVSHWSAHRHWLYKIYCTDSSLHSLLLVKLSYALLELQYTSIKFLKAWAELSSAQACYSRHNCEWC